MFQGLVAQRLVALFIAGLVLFNFPLLALWDHDVQILGLPLFPLALKLIAPSENRMPEAEGTCGNCSPGSA